jgi:hypothetical protein
MISIAAKAATVTISPRPLLYWTSETSFSQGSAGDSNLTEHIADGDAGVYEVGLYMSTSLSSADLAAGYTGFGNASFSVHLSGLKQSTTYPTYYGNPTTVSINGIKAAYLDAFGDPHTDGNGIGANVNLYQNNSNLGHSGNLDSIVVDVGTGTFTSADPRLTVGQSNQNGHLAAILGNPIQLGVVFVDFNGGDFGAFTVTQIAGDGFSLHNNTTGNNIFQTQGVNEVYRLQTYTFVTFIPEPTGIGAVIFSLIAYARYYRRNGAFGIAPSAR